MVNKNISTIIKALFLTIAGASAFGCSSDPSMTKVDTAPDAATAPEPCELECGSGRCMRVDGTSKCACDEESAYSVVSKTCEACRTVEEKLDVTFQGVTFTAETALDGVATEKVLIGLELDGLEPVSIGPTAFVRTPKSIALLPGRYRAAVWNLPADTIAPYRDVPGTLYLGNVDLQQSREQVFDLPKVVRIRGRIETEEVPEYLNVVHESGAHAALDRGDDPTKAGIRPSGEFWFDGVPGKYSLEYIRMRDPSDSRKQGGPSLYQATAEMQPPIATFDVSPEGAATNISFATVDVVVAAKLRGRDVRCRDGERCIWLASSRGVFGMSKTTPGLFRVPVGKYSVLLNQEVQTDEGVVSWPDPLGTINVTGPTQAMFEASPVRVRAKLDLDASKLDPSTQVSGEVVSLSSKQKIFFSVENADGAKAFYVPKGENLRAVVRIKRPDGSFGDVAVGVQTFAEDTDLTVPVTLVEANVDFPPDPNGKSSAGVALVHADGPIHLYRLQRGKFIVPVGEWSARHLSGENWTALASVTVAESTSDLVFDLPSRRISGAIKIVGDDQKLTAESRWFLNGPAGRFAPDVERSGEDGSLRNTAIAPGTYEIGSQFGPLGCLEVKP